MANKNNLFINTVLLTLGTIIPKVLMVILLPLYTYYLTKAEYGTYDLIINIINLIIPIISLQIPSGVFRMLISKDKDKNKTISSALCILFITSIISIITIILIPWQNIILRTMLGSYIILSLFFQFFLEVSRGTNNKKIYAESSIINSILIGVFSVIFLILFKLSLSGIILSLIVSQLITNIYILIRLRFKTYIKYDCISKDYIRELISYSLPLIPNTLSWWIVNLSDRLLITFFLGIEFNAVYAIANKIPSIYSLFYNAFNLSWQEDASINIENKNKYYYSKIFENLLDILCLGLVILISGVPLLFKILIKNDYSAAYCQMPILCMSLLFSSISTFLGGIYIAKKQTKKLGISTIVAALINIVINVLLIRKIGLFTASFSTLFSYLIICIYRYIDIKKNVILEINYKKYIKYFIMLSLVIFTFYKKFFIINMIICFVLSSIFIKKYILALIGKKKK